MNLKNEQEDRAVLLTPAGAAAIAVVRLLGRGVGRFLQQHFSKPIAPGQAVHGNLHDGPVTIDDPIVVSGAGFIDISLHGGPWVVRQCLELAARAGFKIVQTNEACFDSDDAIENEMLAALPLARTEPAVAALVDQPAKWRRFLQDLQTRPPDLHARISAMLEDRSLWWLLHPPTIAIVGIPNAGKSTLANCLFGQALSITADVPGTTRDWVGDWANLDGLPVMLLDTPGQRAAADPIEHAAIEASRGQIERADLVIILLDATSAFEPQQTAIRSRYPQALTLINKCDRPAVWEIGAIPAVQTVATTGQGIDQVRQAIRQRFVSSATINGPCWWTERQREMLQNMLATSQS